MLILLLSAMSGIFVAVAPSEAATRVMPLGDSITHGWNVTGGYRIDLEDRLIAAGLDVDFVGSQSNGPSELADREHEGYPGKRIHEISDRIDSLLPRQRPEVVLLLIGTNDMIGHHLLASAPARLSSLISQIAAGAPGASILVSSLPTLDTTDGDRRVRAYNAAIPGVVADHAARGHRVSFVDMYPALGRNDLADRVHPNRVGYDKMAAVWESALRATLHPVPPLQPVTGPGNQTSSEPGQQPAPSEAAPAPQVAQPPVSTPADQAASGSGQQFAPTADPAPQVVRLPATNSVPAGDTVRPVVRVAGKSVRMDRRGPLRVRMRCLRVSPSPCRGSVTVEHAGRRLASGRFSIGAGRASTVRLQRTGVRRRALGRRAIRVVIRTNVRDSSGTLHSTRTRAILRAATR